MTKEADLFAAVKSNDASKVRTLLAGGVSPNCLDSSKTAPLHYAARHGHPMVAKILLKHGANPNTPDGCGNRPMHDVAHNQHNKGTLDVLKLLLAYGADTSIKGYKDETPLSKTKSYNYTAAAELLAKVQNRQLSLFDIARDLHVNFNIDMLDLFPVLNSDASSHPPSKKVAGSKSEESKLIDLVKAGNVASINSFLNSSGIDTNFQDSSKTSPLHYAVRFGHLGAAHCLLQRGADVNRPDGCKNRPLHDVMHNMTKKDSLHLCKLLLAYGADTSIKGFKDQTPLQKAQAYKFSKAVTLLRDFAAGKKTRYSIAKELQSEQRAINVNSLVQQLLHASSSSSSSSKSTAPSPPKPAPQATPSVPIPAQKSAPQPASPPRQQHQQQPMMTTTTTTPLPPPQSAPVDPISSSSSSSSPSSSVDSTMNAASAHRFMDVDDEDDLENDSPIFGIDKAPDMPLDEALKCITDGVAEMADFNAKICIRAAKLRVKKLKKAKDLGSLSEDGAMAIHIYTQESPLYKVLNALMRKRDRTALKPFFPFLKIFLNALHTLQPLPPNSMIYRGVQGVELASKYPKDRDIVWWSFSSATASIHVLENPAFVGQVGTRVIFNIQVSNAVDIRKYSAIQAEDERLIIPGTMFNVASVMNAGSSLTFIQLKEDEDGRLLDGFEFSSQSS